MTTAVIAIALVGIAPRAPAADSACESLVARVAAGAAPLSELQAHCQADHVTRAVLSATVTPETSGFVVAPGRGGGVTSTWSAAGSARVTWQGRCLARVEEALPESPPTPPLQCLDGAIVREQAQPDRIEDERAQWLMDHEPVLERWRSCRRHAPAERCLDHLLPLSGSGARGDPDVAAWIAERDLVDPNASKVREARCELALVDRAAGLLGFRCQGPLAEDTCLRIWNESFGGDPRCSPDRRVLVVLADVGPAPDGACVTKARDAARSARADFPAARAAALAACAVETPEPGDHAEPAATPAPGNLLEDSAFSPASRSLVHLVLARQEALFGRFKMPPRCERAGDGCVTQEDDGLARIIARGCGNKVWTVWPAGSSGYSDGHWSNEESESLIRLPAAARPRQTFDQTTTTIGRARQSGNYFGGGDNFGRKIYVESDLIEESCVAKKGDVYMCQAYAVGGRHTDMVEWQSPADRRRARALVDADWPRASRRLARWQTELSRGLRLDVVNIEEERWTCAALLADACTGDLGEVCAGLSSQEPGCDGGHRLADGRCRRYRFARLPLQPKSRPPEPP